MSIKLVESKEDSGSPRNPLQNQLLFPLVRPPGTIPGIYMPSPDVISSSFFFWYASPWVNSSIFLASSVSILASPI